MALFGGSRDISIFRHLNRELLGNIISQEVAYYKFDLVKNKTNIYGESTNKVFLPPVLINCLVERTDQNWSTSDLGPNFTSPFTFAFYREDLEDALILPEVGDIIMWYERYFEVDSVIENQLFVGKSDDYNYAPNPLNTGLENFGSSISLVLKTHIIPADKLGISQER